MGKALVGSADGLGAGVIGKKPLGDSPPVYVDYLPGIFVVVSITLLDSGKVSGVGSGSGVGDCVGTGVAVGEGGCPGVGIGKGVAAGP